LVAFNCAEIYIEFLKIIALINYIQIALFAKVDKFMTIAAASFSLITIQIVKKKML
jgi:hypothetical protein